MDPAEHWMVGGMKIYMIKTIGHFKENGNNYTIRL